MKMFFIMQPQYQSFGLNVELYPMCFSQMQTAGDKRDVILMPGL